MKEIFNQKNIAIAGGMTLATFIGLNIAAKNGRVVQGVVVFAAALAVVAAGMKYA